MLRLSLALATLGLVASTAQADVYKTLDAQGQPHYSDVWSPGAVLIKSGSTQSSASPSPSSPATPSKTATAGDESADGGKAAKQVQSDLESVRAQQCKELKEQYDKEIHARRIFQSSGDNSSAPHQYLSDAEADAERVKTRQAMDAACAGGGGN